MIRAAALSYAIVFSLLIGLICSGVLFISSAQKRVEVLHTNKERVLFDSYAAVQLGTRWLSVNDSTVFFHASGDTSEVRHRQWGAYGLIVTRTFKGPHSRIRAALTGTTCGPRLPALYIPGNVAGLKVAGETKIEGDVYVPNAEVERSYIAGKNYTGRELIYGSIRKAETGLPALSKTWQNVTAQTFTNTRPALPYNGKDSTYSFQQQTTYYQQLAPMVITGNIAGNVVLHSFDSIFVAADARLSNVILVAPVVRFEKGFTGTVQVVAHERITCEQGVTLLYPSVLVLNEPELRDENRRRQILIDEGAMVLGGILLTSQSPDFRKMTLLDIRPQALVAGLVYNSGETELTGRISGSLYTARLIAHAGGGEYTNQLVDARIEAALPPEFLLPEWLEEQQRIRTKVIAWL